MKPREQITERIYYKGQYISSCPKPPAFYGSGGVSWLHSLLCSHCESLYRLLRSKLCSVSFYPVISSCTQHLPAWWDGSQSWHEVNCQLKQPCYVIVLAASLLSCLQNKSLSSHVLYFVCVCSFPK